MDLIRKIPKKFTKKFGNKVINRQYFRRKTGLQTVILRCLRSLNLNWYKSYDKKYKNAKNSKDENLCFCTK